MSGHNDIRGILLEPNYKPTEVLPKGADETTEDNLTGIPGPEGTQFAKMIEVAVNPLFAISYNENLHKSYLNAFSRRDPTKPLPHPKTTVLDASRRACDGITEPARPLISAPQISFKRDCP